MSIWKDENGNDYPDKINKLIDSAMSELNDEEKELYEKLTQDLIILFKKFNKKYCPKCSNEDWVNSRLYTQDGVGKQNDRGCCVHCFGNKGYFRSYNYDNHNVTHVKKFFKRKDGFFDPKKMSCSLPRQLRSSTCLRYVCYQKKDVSIRDKAADIVGVLENLKWIQLQRMGETIPTPMFSDRKINPKCEM